MNHPLRRPPFGADAPFCVQRFFISDRISRMSFANRFRSLPALVPNRTPGTWRC